MPSARTSPNINSSLSSYSHTTPNPHNINRAFSPSSPEDFMVTPRDGEPLEGTIAFARGTAVGLGPKGRKGLDVNRRSVRVRDSSEGQHSSPSIKLELSSSLDSTTMDYSLQHSTHPLSHDNLLPRSSSSSSSGRAPISKPRTKNSVPPPPRPTSSSSASAAAALATSATLAQAQALGITAEKFEQAKQQVIRFLAADASTILPTPSTCSSSSSNLEEIRPRVKAPISKRVTSKTSNTSTSPVAVAPIAPLVNGSTLNRNGKSSETSSSPATLSISTTPTIPLSTSTSSSTYLPQTSISPVVSHHSNANSNSYSAPSTTSIPQSETFGSILDGGALTESSANTSVQAERSVRSRASLEEIIERTGERKRREEDVRKDREMRLWAEQGLDDSSSEEELEAVSLVSNLMGIGGSGTGGISNGPNSTPRTMNKINHHNFPRSSSHASPLLPSPSFSALISPAHHHSTLHSGGTIPSSLARRGMMERFMSDRPAAKEEEEEDEDMEDSHLRPSIDSHHIRLQQSHSHQQQQEQQRLGEPIHDLDHLENYRAGPTPTHSQQHPTSSSKQQQQQQQQQSRNNGSPPVRSLGFSPDAMMTSPIPSRSRSGLLFSPDVARLLRSELDELEANNTGTGTTPVGATSGQGGIRGRGSPRKRIEVALEERFSSPYQPSNSYRGSPYSNGLSPQKRARDHEEPDSVKRARYNHQVDGLLSPTPSTPTVSLRAPSFCDSSPAMSDKASSIGGGGGVLSGSGGIGGLAESSVIRPSSATFFNISPTHPASAPDYLYHGLPSSSPASSENSLSDYGHRIPRTSPGPSTTTSVSMLNHHQQQSNGLPPRSQSEASISFTTTIPSASASTSTSTSASTFTSKSSFLTTESLEAPSPNAITSEALALSESAKKRLPTLKRAETLPNIALGADAYAKPAWSYAALIGQAIFSTETRKISLAEIYTFIMASYPYYKREDSGWQNSIRHNLSLNECFIKTMRGPANPGKGCLWAISVGCEEQFADGGFAKKGALPMVNKGSADGSIPDAPFSATSSTGRMEGISKLKGKRSRGQSQSSRGGSPTASFGSNLGLVELELPASSQTARAISPTSGRGSSPPTPPPITLSLPRKYKGSERQASTSGRKTKVVIKKRRRGSDASMNSIDSLSSLEDDDEEEESIVSVPVVKKSSSKASTNSLASAYVHRPALPQTSPALSLSRVQPFETANRGKALTSPAESYQMYDQINNNDRPYESGNWSQIPSNQNHRALASLTSPELGHSQMNNMYDRQGHYLPPHQQQQQYHQPQHHHHQQQHAQQHQQQYQQQHLQQQQQHHYQHQQGRPIPHPLAAQSTITTPLNSGLQSHFLPAPHIFPGTQNRGGSSSGGSARGGNRTDQYEEKEMNRPQSVMSPSVHTRSPVSSMRRGPRVPTSPLLGTTGGTKLFGTSDPEKKRARSHHPSIAALAAADVSASDTFRSPPRHLRSPSSRPLQSVTPLQAANMLTPGTRVRPWGSPGRGVIGGVGVSPGMYGDNWGFGLGDPFSGQVEAELERFMVDGEGDNGVQGSGGSNLGMPRYWPSPSNPNSNSHVDSW